MTLKEARRMNRKEKEAWMLGNQEGFNDGYDAGYEKGLEEGSSLGFRMGRGRIEFPRVPCPHCGKRVPYPFFKGPFSSGVEVKDEKNRLCPYCGILIPEKSILKEYVDHRHRT